MEKSAGKTMTAVSVIMVLFFMRMGLAAFEDLVIGCVVAALAFGFVFASERKKNHVREL